MVTAIGLTAFLGLWTLFIIVEVVAPRVKRRRARKAQVEALDAQIRLLDGGAK